MFVHEFDFEYVSICQTVDSHDANVSQDRKMGLFHRIFYFFSIHIFFLNSTSNSFVRFRNAVLAVGRPIICVCMYGWMCVCELVF